MNKPDSSTWKEEIKNEHKQMVTNNVWEPFNKKDLQEGKGITSTWACKKKATVHTFAD